MEKSEQINTLAEALAKAQAKFTSVNKGRTVKVKTKAGFEYTYKYAELSDILDMVRGPLAENGLAIIQTATTQENKLVINTMLLHASGQFIKSDLNLPSVEIGNNAIQAIGGSITYGRRYALCSMLGIASDEDTDAKDAGKTAAKPTDIKPSTMKPDKTPMPSQGTKSKGFSA